MSPAGGEVVSGKPWKRGPSKGGGLGPPRRLSGCGYLPSTMARWVWSPAIKSEEIDSRNPHSRRKQQIPTKLSFELHTPALQTQNIFKCNNFLKSRGDSNNVHYHLPDGEGKALLLSLIMRRGCSLPNTYLNTSVHFTKLSLLGWRDGSAGEGTYDQGQQAYLLHPHDGKNGSHRLSSDLPSTCLKWRMPAHNKCRQKKANHL